MFHITKKGSSMYRKILDRDLNFITASRLKSKRKTTGDFTVEMETIRNTFKSINYADIPATDHDALVRFYLQLSKSQGLPQPGYKTRMGPQAQLLGM